MSDTDPTSPWYEFISYCRCCDSLGIPIRLQSFMRYQQYLREIGFAHMKIADGVGTLLQLLGLAARLCQKVEVSGVLE